MVVLYVNYKEFKRNDLKIMSIHGYVYLEEPTKYRPNKYVTKHGYIKSKTTEVVNPITYVDGYVTSIENYEEDVINIIKEILIKFNSTEVYITGNYKVISFVNNILKNDEKYDITTKLLSDTTDFGMDIVSKILEIGHNNYNNNGIVNKLLLYNNNSKEYFKPNTIRHNLLHHNHVYYTDTTDKYTHITFGYKNEFTVGKPDGESYYGLARIDNIIPEIDVLRDMTVGMMGGHCYTYTIKLRILYSSVYNRLYRLFGKDVYRYIVNVPDSKRDKTRMLRGIEMLDTLVVVAIEPPGLINTAFKNLKILESINKLYSLGKQNTKVLDFTFIDIKDMFKSSKKNKKGIEIITYNDNITGVNVKVHTFNIYVQIGVDILPKNNLKRIISKNNTEVWLVVEKMGDKVYRQYTMIIDGDERMLQCAYFSGVVYVK